MAMVPIAMMIIFSLFGIQFPPLVNSKELILQVPQSPKLDPPYCNISHHKLSLCINSSSKILICKEEENGDHGRVCEADLEVARMDNFCAIWEVGLGVVLMVIIIPGVFISIYFLMEKTRDDLLLDDALRALPGMPREFRFVELSKATGQFAVQNKIGEGGFGKVYKGVLPKIGVVAVKKFSRETGNAAFLAELTVINRLRHRNIVSLLGWSYKNKKLLLVYAYKSNGSLDKHLYNSSPPNGVLSWERRSNIIWGLASSLHYLHNEYDQKVIHRDIKSSNIMLDSSFNACLGDFGLARTIDVEQSSYDENSGVPGTWGYMAPEYLHSGKATGRSDVFSFGAVVLEVVCGRRPGQPIGGFQLLVYWVWTMHKQGKLLEVVDIRLEDNYEANEAERLLLLGLSCSHPVASERPKTQAIMRIICRSMPPPVLPLTKPAFVLPRGMEREVASSTTSSIWMEQDLYPATRTFKWDTELKDRSGGEDLETKP